MPNKTSGKPTLKERYAKLERVNSILNCSRKELKEALECEMQRCTSLAHDYTKLNVAKAELKEERDNLKEGYALLLKSETGLQQDVVVLKEGLDAHKALVDRYSKVISFFEAIRKVFIESEELRGKGNV